MIDPHIEAVISNDARIVTPSMPVAEAAQHLRDPSVPALVVTSANGTPKEAPIGIVTDSDLIALLAETAVPATIAQCMSSPVTTIQPNITPREAADRMRKEGVRHLPVVDEQGRYRGIVSASTVAPYLSRRNLSIDWKGSPLDIA